LCRGAPEDPKQFLGQTSAEQAHRQINLRGRERDLEPRSTVVALIVREAQAFWVHLWRQPALPLSAVKQLLGRTRDHSMVQVLVEAGEVTEEQMATHPDQNKLLRSIGGEDPPKPTHGNASLAAARPLPAVFGWFLGNGSTANEMATALAATQSWTNRVSAPGGPSRGARRTQGRQHRGRRSTATRLWTALALPHAGISQGSIA
jgi:hypothetical protein